MTRPMTKPWNTPVKPFFEVSLATPIPGKLGTDPETYLGVLEMQGLKASSRYEYHRELSRLAEMYPDLELGDIARIHIDRFLVARTVTGAKLSQATRRKIIAVLLGSSWATSAGLCHENPMAGIKRPKLLDPNPTAWTAQEMAQILAVQTTARNHLLVELLARTGQRQGVIRNLTWGEVDLTGKQPTIHFGPGKNGKYHELPIQRELLHDLIVSHRLTNPAPTDWCCPARSARAAGRLEGRRSAGSSTTSAGEARVSKPWEPIGLPPLLCHPDAGGRRRVLGRVQGDPGPLQPGDHHAPLPPGPPHRGGRRAEGPDLLTFLRDRAAVAAGGV